MNKKPKAEDQSITELVRAAQSGHKRQLERLLQQHYPVMLAIAFRYSHDEEIAKDAVQEATVQVVRNLDRLREASKFKAWVGRIVINCVRLQFRRTARNVPFYPSLTRTQSDPHVAPDERVETREELESVYNWLESKRTEDAELVDKLLVKGLSLKVVSGETGLSVGALKTRVHRLRNQLRAHMEKTNDLPLATYRPSGHLPMTRSGSKTADLSPATGAA